MYKCAIRWLCAIALLVSTGAARATFHLWQLNEIFSNADGTVQFIELSTGVGSQQFLTGHTITSSQGATTHLFTFPSDLPGDTAGKTFLIGTTGFAALGLVTPDYIVPNGFLFTANGNVNFADVDTVSWTALPVDGVMSINHSGAMAMNSPMNFAGITGSVPAMTAISRTYVASYGSDTNTSSSCNFAAPCRTFGAALSRTTNGGEILAVDGSGYGSLIIDRSVSIIANPGVFAGIGVFGGNGITIATAGVNVVLRGLTLNGQGGSYGVAMMNGARLSIENCVFANFAGAGAIAILVQTAATVNIINTLVRDNYYGVYLSSGALASISGSQFVGNSQGGIVTNGGSATVSDNMVARNGTGLWNMSGTLKSLGNNNVTDNGSNTNGTITPAP